MVEVRHGWDNTPAATCRCVTEDLAFPAEACAGTLEALRQAPIIAAFLDRRGNDPAGSESPIQQLRPLLAFSLHTGRHRGATWHQEKVAIVWLLAYHIHREGSPDDAYSVFERLHRVSRLLPTRADAEHVVAAREPRFDDIVSQQIRPLLQMAYRNPGQIHEGVLGERIAVRVVYEDEEIGLLAVAISTKIRPGGLLLPPQWLGLVVAAFFPTIPVHEVEGVADLAGTVLRSDEIGFCAFVGAS